MIGNLGISVYPDLSTVDEIKNYFKLASKYGATRVFSSMFSVKGTNDEILNYFERLIYDAHEENLKVSLDVNPMFFEKIGAKFNDLSIFNKINVDILRMDLDFGVEKNIELVNNPHNIEIEFNTCVKIANELIENGVDGSKFLMCHNFYPQRYTGLKWNKFLSTNEQLKNVSSDIRIGAFISSNSKDTHGVWNSVCGLPTVEKMRTYDIDLQYRLLKATGTIDDILIGNAYASEKEFYSLYEVINGESLDSNVQKDKTFKLLSDHGFVDLSKPIKKIKIEVDDGATCTEKEILFKFFPHVDLGDSSEWIWRDRMPRFLYSNESEQIVPRITNEKMFDVGSVVIVNDNYKHYAGEVQIVKIPIVNDGTRNLVGRLCENEFDMIELINDRDIVMFIEKE